MLSLKYLALALVAAQASYEPQPAVLEQFQELEFRYSGGEFSNKTFRYRLHAPRKVDSSKTYPLLVWLHGGKERGDDNRAQLRWVDFVFDKLPSDQVDYFLLAVQVPADGKYWYESSARPDVNNGHGSPGDMLSVANAILEETMRNQPIDAARVYLAGVSSGGSGSWEMAMRYPERFAAVTSMSGGGANPSQLNLITEVPIWTFHAEADRPQSAQRTAQTLEDLGGASYFTLIRSDPDDLSDWLHKHDSWSVAIRQYGVINWLFDQRRGSPVVPPPGFGSSPWPILATAAIVGCASCAAFGYWWRFRRI
jgi:predicted peptidase